MSPEHLQVWRFHCLSGQPLPMFNHPQNNYFFLRANWNFPVPKLCLLPLVTPLCTAKKRVLCVPYILALGILQTAIRSPLSLSSEDWTDPFLLSLESLSALNISWLWSCSKMLMSLSRPKIKQSLVSYFSFNNIFVFPLLLIPLFLEITGRFVAHFFHINSSNTENGNVPCTSITPCLWVSAFRK